MQPGPDQVFKALADPTRRLLLDRLHERNGQSLGELCEHLAMTRQATTQHLAVLAAANLVSTVRRGRQKLHYLNPVPLQEIQERWIDKFERPRLRAISAVKRRAEDSMTQQSDQASGDEATGTPRIGTPTYVYVTYIQSTPERVWHALTDADLTAAYWGHSNVSDWQAGSSWEHRRTDGSGVADVVGTVEQSDPPTRLVTTWAEPGDEQTPPSRVTFDIERHGDIVRLTVTHEGIPTEEDRAEAARGWPAVLSNLKSLLETGSPLPQEPWLVPRR